LYIFSIQLSTKKVTGNSPGSPLNVVEGVGGWDAATAAEDMSYSAWKQVIRISLKQHCTLLG